MQPLVCAVALALPARCLVRPWAVRGLASRSARGARRSGDGAARSGLRRDITDRAKLADHTLWHCIAQRPR